MDPVKERGKYRIAQQGFVSKTREHYKKGVAK